MSISDEAIEAGAQAIRDVATKLGAGSAMPTLMARAALEAAAPHMLAPIVKLADDWHERGEADMAYSKTFEDEDIAMAFLTEGANRVEAARHIRNALGATK